jgi:hypothetical protein
MTDEINAYWHPDGSGIDAVFAERDALLVEVAALKLALNERTSAMDAFAWRAKMEVDRQRQEIKTLTSRIEAADAEVERLASDHDKLMRERDEWCLRAVNGLRYLTALQQIAAAGPMTTDDWRWKVAQDAVKGQGDNPYDEIARLTAEVSRLMEVPPEAFAYYPEIPDTPEERAYRKGWNDAVVRMHGPFEAVSDDDVSEIFGAPV